MSLKKPTMRVVRNRKFMVFKKMPLLHEVQVNLWINENRKKFGSYFSALAKGKVLKRVYYEEGVYHFAGINFNSIEDEWVDELDIVGLTQPHPYKIMVSMLFELEIDLMPPRVEGYEGVIYSADNDVAEWIGDQIATNQKVKKYLFQLAEFNKYIIKNEDDSWQGVNYKLNANIC